MSPSCITFSHFGNGGRLIFVDDRLIDIFSLLSVLP